MHTHACVPCSFCLSRGLRPRRSAVAPQATDWLLAPGSTRSLRPAARAAWERSARAHCVSCWCTSRAVSTGGVSANTETATMRATTAAVHTHVCVPCSACLSRCLRRRRSAAAVHITPLPAHLPPETPSCPCSVGEECEGTLCFVLYVACCEHGRRFSKRRNSNDEDYNGGGAHPRVCTLLGLSVSLPATTAFGSGCSHYVTACPLATRDASS